MCLSVRRHRSQNTGMHDANLLCGRRIGCVMHFPHTSVPYGLLRPWLRVK